MEKSVGALPDGTIFTIDYNRHGKAPGLNRPNDKTLNMLFCDGHGDTVSAREAAHAIRFNRSSSTNLLAKKPASMAGFFLRAENCEINDFLPIRREYYRTLGSMMD